MKMNYREILKVATKPYLKPFDTFTKWGPFSLNGYVVIPDDLPVDYTDEFYEQIDDGPVGGLTFGGYLTSVDGELVIILLDERAYFHDEQHTVEELHQIEQLKDRSCRVIGFDDAHFVPNELSADDGIKYLSNQLKMIEIGY